MMHGNMNIILAISGRKRK